jgi:hypothetical protein
MSNLFGYSIERAKKVPKGPSFVQKDNQDGATPIVAGGYFGQYVDIDGTVKNEWELITRYRDMAVQPEVDEAVDDIVNESICGGLDDVPVSIELSNLNASDKIKKLIREEFQHVLELLDFENRAYDLFRRWYIDGRLFFHKVIDPSKPGEGIIELRYIDPRKIRKVIEIDNKPNIPTVDPSEVFTQKTVEYYIYNTKGVRGSDSSGIKIAPDAICYVPSGILELNKNMVISHLHKAIKSVNQLRMIEDSLVIYRLSRAPERRIFYIDVGNLPKVKAEQYLRDVMSRYRNKLVYDASTGEIRDDRKFMSMLEDFWLPRREGGRGTEITTLPGGQNLGELEDIKYFQRKLYKSLNVPDSRLESEQTFNIGRSAEISRDEIKFQKFINRLRKKFSELFHDILKTQLLLKGIISLEDWEAIKNHIQYDFIADNYFNELKESEIMNDRLALLGAMDPYVGRYFSMEYIKRQVLRQTDTEIEEIQGQIETEIADGKIMDPMAMDAGMGMPGMDPMAMGAQDPNAMAQAAPPAEPAQPSSAELKKAEF